MVRSAAGGVRGCAGAALYRRAMLVEVGLFDPDFFISYEDADLNWRAQLAGWRARYVPTAVVRHREGVFAGSTADGRCS